ncbi:MAG: DUF1653 domain-containing protein [Granulosicoccus sp.]
MTFSKTDKKEPIPQSATQPPGAPVPGLYKHYKGQHYQVLGMAQHSESDEWLVVYQALYGERGFWLRPLSIWLEPIDAKTLASEPSNPDTVSRERFQLIESSQLTLSQLTKQTKGESA